MLFSPSGALDHQRRLLPEVFGAVRRAGLSDSQIAEHVGVAVHTVSKYRAELETTCELRKSTTRQGRDGRTTDTTNIGTKAAEPEEEEDDDSSMEAVIDGPGYNCTP